MKTKLVRTKVIGGIILAVIAVLCWVLLIGPSLHKPAELEARKVAAQEEYAAATTQLGRLKTASENLGAATAQAQKLAESFPDTVDQAAIKKAAATAAAAAGIPASSVVSVTTGPVEEYNPSQGAAGAAGAAPAAPAGTSEVKQMKVTIVVKATLGKTGTFTQNLTSGRPLFSITNVSSQAEGLGGTFQTTVDTYTYLLPPLPAPPAPAP